MLLTGGFFIQCLMIFLHPQTKSNQDLFSHSGNSSLAYVLESESLGYIYGVIHAAHSELQE